MEMNVAQRHSLGVLLQMIRLRRFEGNAKRAYTAAGVNSATWKRAEQGETIKPGSLTKILLALLPHTGGDWTVLADGDRMVASRAQIAGLVGAPTQDEPGYVSAPGERVEGGVGDSEVLRAIEAMRGDMQAMEQRLSERLDRLEGEGS